MLGVVLAITFNPTAAMATDYDVVGTEATWRWHVYDDSIMELEIDENGGTFSPALNWDGFDNFGYVDINGTRFNTNGSSAAISGGSVTFTDTDHPGDTVNYQFQDNWYQTTVSLDTAGSIKLFGNLGSDSEAEWITIDGKLFSYQKNLNNVVKDPIFYWSTPPTTYTNGNDNPELLVVSGTSLTLKLHAFAHQENRDINHIDYMAKFAQFASENVNRTDIFNYTTWSPAPAPSPSPSPAPVEVHVRKSSNLQFHEAMYGTDKLSDPDGQLRKTVDAIDAKYGNLIK